MIVGTAGHIDHGKTSLVKALTGVDADRLQEEKARGITIDLGYAYRPLPGGDTLGFVDVPGHEKFIHNMLAGVTGIDYVMLVVAADDGPMPQTLEHLAILGQLGLTRGIVALTKVDRVDAARLAAATREVQAMLATSACTGFDVLPVSSVTGDGVEALLSRLVQAAQSHATSPPPQWRSGGYFRLAIDRSFTLSGIGTVVTGTVFAGRVAVGDRLMISPLGVEVRVRGLHAQNRVADTGGVGQRCAVNIVAPQLDKRDITRGQWLLGEALHAPTDRLDVRLSLSSTETKALRHWTPVHVHLGAKHVTGRVALLNDEPLRGGHDALAQLLLDEPIGALHGDRFIIRDQSAQRTLGGGQVLDAFALSRGRRKPARIATLEALEAEVPSDALRALLDVQASGVDLRWYARLHNLPDAALASVLQAVPMHALAGGGTAPGTSGTPGLAFSLGHWARCVEQLLGWLAAYHQREPDSAGARADELRRALPDQPAAAVMAGILESLVGDGRLLHAGSRFQLPGHEVKLNAVEQALWERALPVLDAAGLAPPRVAQLALQLGAKEELLRHLLGKLVRMGRLHAVRREVFFLPELIASLATQTEALAKSNAKGLVTVGPFRERTGLHRNLGIPMLEYFDRAGFTWRRDDGRRLRRESAQVFGPGGAVK